MISINLIIMSAGNATRFRKNTNIKKHWLRVDSKPLWLHVADNISSKFTFNRVIIVANKDEVNYMKKFCDYDILEGGNSRQESLLNALKEVDSEFVLVNDAARFNIDFSVIDNLFAQNLNNYDCIFPSIGVVDTVFMRDGNHIEYLNRENVKLVQTPQLSRVDVLLEALKLGNFSDESSAICNYGGRVLSIEGSRSLSKLTFFDDIKNCNLDFIDDIRVGYGFDVHKFINNKKMFLGGVFIDCGFGLKAHSDGDVVIHSLCDAILGAVGAGDIGEWFPDSSSEYKNIDSKILLKRVVDFVFSIGFNIVNVDIMIMAQIPIITPYKALMIETLSHILLIEKHSINIKATTMEGMSFIGRKEGICASSSVSLKYNVSEKT